LEIVFGAKRYRASLLAGKETILALAREMSDAEVPEAQPIELSIVGKGFLCLYATAARRLYVIDVPGLPQIAGFNGMPPPRAMECGR
jgi:ParB-like chromosome segregation protein Spo0J